MAGLNVNTIADEAGTGGPDFVAMPSVGGSPIVESGSNSDGEWTRWADGTIKAAHFFTSSGGVAEWFFPTTFSAIPYVNISIVRVSGTGDVFDLRSLSSAGIDTTSIKGYQFNRTVTDTQARAMLTAYLSGAA